MRSRRAEIEEALRARVYAISDPAETADPEYADGLRAALDAALEYGLAGIEAGAGRLPPIPATLLAQARMAARNAVSLEIVLRRYFGGYSLLGDFLIEAAHAEEMNASRLKRILRTQATLFDRLIAEVSEEYGREREARVNSPSERRLAYVRSLLSGEMLDASELNYNLAAWHVAAIVKGGDAIGALGELAAALDRRLLAVKSDELTAWAWLGGRRKLQVQEIECAVSASWPKQITIVIGEPAFGIGGWRFTHRQARAALPIALTNSGPMTRYGDVALLASAIGDEVLATSLREIYIAPLAEERDGGVTLRETLLAYFDARRHVSATASSLGVSRQTINSRLRAVEARIGRPIDACAVDIEIALRLERLSIRQVFRAD